MGNITHSFYELFARVICMLYLQHRCTDNTVPVSSVTHCEICRKSKRANDNKPKGKNLVKENTVSLKRNESEEE